MIKKCSVCGKEFDTEKTGRYKICSDECAKKAHKRNALNYMKGLKQSNPKQYEKQLERARKHQKKVRNEYRLRDFDGHASAILKITDKDDLVEYLYRNFYLRKTDSDKGVIRK